MYKLSGAPDANPIPRKAPIIADATSFSWLSTIL